MVYVKILINYILKHRNCVDAVFVGKLKGGRKMLIKEKMRKKVIEDIIELMEAGYDETLYGLRFGQLDNNYVIWTEDAIKVLERLGWEEVIRILGERFSSSNMVNFNNPIKVVNGIYYVVMIDTIDTLDNMLAGMDRNKMLDELKKLI